MDSRANRRRLAAFLHHPWTDAVVALLIVVSVAATVVECLAAPRTVLALACGWIGLAIAGLFMVELALRAYAAPGIRQFLGQYWLDLIAVVPLVPALRVLRLLRLLRLVRLGLFVSRRVRHLSRALSEGLAENLLIGFFLPVVVLFGAVGILLADRGVTAGSFGEALWWSLFTLMSGEPAGGIPGTGMGRLVSLVTMVGGASLFALFTGVISAVMVSRLRAGIDARGAELEALSDHVVVCGWSRSGLRLLRALQVDAATGQLPVVVVAEAVEETDLLASAVGPGPVLVVRADYTSPDVLRRAGIERARRAVVLADKSRPRADQDRDARTILTALTIEKMCRDRAGGRGISTCCELLHREAEKVRLLEMAGVEDVVEVDDYVGHLMAHTTHACGLIQILDELLAAERDCEFARVALPPAFVDCAYGEVLGPACREWGWLPLAVVPAGSPDRCRPLVNPPFAHRLRAGDELMVIRHVPASRGQAVPVTRTAAAPAPEGACGPTASRLEDLSGHCVICGWNRTVPKIVQQLRAEPRTAGLPVVLAAELTVLPPELAATAEPGRVFFVAGDYTLAGVLEDLRIVQARTAIIVADKARERTDPDRDARSILAALTIEKLNPRIHTCVELLQRSPEKLELLDLANVEDVVVGDDYVGHLIAHGTRTPGLVGLIDELLSSGRGNSILKLPMAPDLAGCRFVEGVEQLKRLTGGLLFAVETRPEAGDGTVSAPGPGRPAGRECRRYLICPAAEHRLCAGDALFVVNALSGSVEVIE